MLTTFKRQVGMTLIELLVAMAVGIIVVGGAIKVHINTIEVQSDNLKRARLNMDMRTMMDIMIKDIRRAGFSTDQPAGNQSCLLDNVFDTVSVLTTGGNTAGKTCILYSYNRNNNACGVVDNSEHFGFAHYGSSLMMRDKGNTSLSCIVDSDNSWQTLNDQDIAITELSFTLDEKKLNVTAMQNDISTGDGICSAGEACNTCQATQDCLAVRKVTITLAGQLASGISQTISEQVRIRNDKFISAP